MTKLVKQKRNPLNIKNNEKAWVCRDGQTVERTCAQGVRVPRGKEMGYQWINGSMCTVGGKGTDRKQDKMWGPSKVRGQTGDSHKKSGPPRMTTSVGEWEIKIHLQLEFCYGAEWCRDKEKTISLRIPNHKPKFIEFGAVIHISYVAQHNLNRFRYLPEAHHKYSLEVYTLELSLKELPQILFQEA